MSENFVKFDRNEDKYIVTGVQADRIHREVTRRLSPSYPNPLTKWTLIRSVYLDSPDLQYYRDYLNRIADRIKIRIRMYGNDGVWNTNEKYLELKENENGTNRKTRVRLFSDDSQDFLKGDMKKFMDRVNKRIKDDNLEPITSITYVREAFASPDGFRITFDRDINYDQETSNLNTKGVDWSQAIVFGEKYNRAIDIIMEVKHNGEPKWFKDLVKTEGIQPTPFSKYAYAIYNIVKKTT